VFELIQFDYLEIFNIFTDIPSMLETGIIMAKSGNIATIVLARSEKCKDCSACSIFGENSVRIDARNDLDAAIGDAVEVEIESKHVIGHSFLLFLFPILAMIGGYFAGMRLAGITKIKGEGSGIIGAFAMLCLSFLCIKLYDLYWRKRHKSNAVVIGFAQLPQEDLNQHHILG
jgi:sigma-E factor negative regulatory protein RseC